MDDRGLNPEEVFVKRLEEVRTRVGLSRQKVAELANPYLDKDQKITADVVVQFEIGRPRRRVRLNEALAICAGLDVSPAHMFVPLKDSTPVRLGVDSRVHLVRASSVRKWFQGINPLPSAKSDESWARFWLDEVPEGLRRSRRRQIDAAVDQQSKEES